MKNRQHFFFRMALITQLCILVFSFVVCNNRPPESSETPELQGYELYIFEQGFAHFSFEKPRYYDWSENLTTIRDDYEGVSILRGANLLSNLTRPQSLTVSIFKTSAGHPSVSMEVESIITRMKGTYPDFVLIDRSPVSVGGISAEQLVWYGGPNSSRILLPPLFPCSLFSGLAENMRAKYTTVIEPTLVEEVFFEHGGLIWNIEIMSGPAQNEVEQAKADFEHILQTFKILE